MFRVWLDGFFPLAVVYGVFFFVLGCGYLVCFFVLFFWCSLGLLCGSLRVVCLLVVCGDRASLGVFLSALEVFSVLPLCGRQRELLFGILVWIIFYSELGGLTVRIRGSQDSVG